MDFIPDCLVLKIEEHCSEGKGIDTTLYVLYDKKEHNYVLRGKRQNFLDKSPCVYSFICDHTKVLADFISFVVDKENHWSYTLYNYDNLPYESYDITYDFFKKYESQEYELAGYDNVKYTRKEIIRNLRMLRKVYNIFH